MNRQEIFEVLSDAVKCTGLIKYDYFKTKTGNPNYEHLYQIGILLDPESIKSNNGK